MRSPSATLGAILLLGGRLSAALALGEDVTVVKGEIVHLACPLAAGSNRGDTHAACAMDCARKDEPMALMTDDAVYLIEGSYRADRNAKLLDFVARQVEAKGTVTERDGTFYLNIAAMMVTGVISGVRAPAADSR